MKEKQKIIVLKIILAVVLISIILILLTNFNTITGKVVQENFYSWTKAICNQTHCQDYEIKCSGNNLISKNPITGAIIEIPKDWVDPRNETYRHKIC